MGVNISPVPAGALPYKEGFGQAMGDAMQSVAATISNYYTQKKQMAQQSADTQIKLMQMGLGGDPKTLIKSLKQGYNIPVTEDSVRAMQAQQQATIQAQQQQAQAQLQESQAKIKEIQDQQAWRKQVGEAFASKDPYKIMQTVRQGQVEGFADPRLDIMEHLAEQDLTPDQLKGVLKMKELQESGQMDWAKMTMNILADPEAVKQYGGPQNVAKIVEGVKQSALTGAPLPDIKMGYGRQDLQTAIEYSREYGTDLSTALLETQHPDLAVKNRKPLSAELERQRTQAELATQAAELKQINENIKRMPTVEQAQAQHKAATEHMEALTTEEKAQTDYLNAIKTPSVQEKLKDKTTQERLAFYKMALSSTKNADEKVKVVKAAADELKIPVEVVSHFLGLGTPTLDFPGGVSIPSQTGPPEGVDPETWKHIQGQ